jgi:hypothetical protein
MDQTDEVQTLTIRDVPPGELEQSITDLKKLGATDVTKTAQDDGNFTLVATFPAVPTSPATPAP